MEMPITHNLEPSQEDNIAHLGHWQPALRPDMVDDMPSSVRSNYFSMSSADSNPHAKSHFQTSQDQLLPEPSVTGSTNDLQEGFEMPSTDDADMMNIDTNKGHRPNLSETEGVQPSAVGPDSGNDYEQVEESKNRVDPAWGISRMQTRQILSSATRSSSFPAPDAPESSSESYLMASTPKTETGNFLMDKRAIPPAISSGVESWDWLGQAPQEEDFAILGTSKGDILSGVSQPADGRFEEGVPLIQAENRAGDTNEVTVPSDRDEAFEGVKDEDSSFFAQISSQDPGTKDKSPVLDRKSTGDVLTSLHFSDPVVPDSPPSGNASHEKTFIDESYVDASYISGAQNEVQVPPGDADDMWKAALDDDEFLVEDADDLLPDSDPGSPSSLLPEPQGSNQPGGQFELPESQTTPLDSTNQSSKGIRSSQNQSNPYEPHQRSASDTTQLSPTTRSTVGLNRPALAPMYSFQSHLQQTFSAPVTTESFVDQAKGGYKSPYDLPLELSKPKKRAHVPQPIQSSKNVPPPPPRSSSIMDGALQSPYTPTVPSLPTTAATPTQFSPTSHARTVSNGPQASANKTIKPSASSFFEELPVSSRPRPASGQGRYTPQQQVQFSQPQTIPQSPPKRMDSMPNIQESPPRSADPYAQYQLRPPERLDPYANVPLQAPPLPQTGIASTRYSPAPANSLTGPRPNPSPRYSPVPPAQVSGPPSTNRYTSQPLPVVGSQQSAGVSNNRYSSQPPQPPAPPSAPYPFQPRTSSPLVHHKASIDEQNNPLQSTFDAMPNVPANSYHYSGPSSMSPPASSRPLTAKATIVDESFAPPKRSQTQSPSKMRTALPFSALADENLVRSASVLGQPSVLQPSAPFEVVPPQRPSVRARGLTQEIEFTPPLDESQFDPLQRWKGAPCFQFGFGGTVVSSFPKHVPRYGVNMAKLQIKSMPGQVSVRDLREIVPLPDHVISFPGPLRLKSKKKDILAWVNTYIQSLESQSITVDPQITPDLRKRQSEKILLCKVLRAMVENDGSLEGSPDALKSINAILSPELFAIEESTASQYGADHTLSGIYRPSGANIRSETADPMAVETLRKCLLRGNRQDAVWHAVDNRLWSHAFVIASTLDRTVWRQLVQEFVRQEVKTIGVNSQSLSALYEIFGGNLEESIDQLVPPSARAGLQMVSKVDSGGPTKNALDGLDRWRETLALVLNNRSQGDHQALATLGRLLGDYGRIEASHICYLFSKSPAQPVIFNGSDDPQANIVLLGANHRARPLDIWHDHDSIILTEIYEFAALVLGSGSMSASMPYLASYKLERAIVLAENGMKTEAQSYCDAIAATLKSSTKLSPYYHPAFLGALEELSDRIRQTPTHASSSWIAKPSLEKVSGSVWNKFSSFVAGDDSDAESKGSGKDAVEAGPFARISGTPSLSRSGSQSDIQGSYQPNVGVQHASTTASRYAPNGLGSTRSSSDLTRGRSSLDSQRPFNVRSTSTRPGHQEPVNIFHQGAAQQLTNSYQGVGMSPPRGQYQASPPQSSYMPNSSLYASPPSNLIASQESYMPTPSPKRSHEPSPSTIPEVPTETIEQQSFGGYLPNLPSEVSNSGTLVNNSYEPSGDSYGYEPPQDTGYVPYVPEPDSPEVGTKQQKPKKKSFMDDDDDGNFPRTSGPSASYQEESPPNDEVAARKKANDAAADAAFRAAAEADAARQSEKKIRPKSSGWFGGWLAGTKKPDGLDASPAPSAKGSQPTVYKAKLGEAKMKLYYDENLKKWVNPDNPNAATNTATPPPPPRMGGPPVRAQRAPPSDSGPPSGPPSRTSTPASGMSGPASGPPLTMLPSMLAPAPTSAPTSDIPSGTATPVFPPPPPPSMAGSRPGTAMSNASSIDDLIGPATGSRKAAKGKRASAKAGRYIDVMAK